MRIEEALHRLDLTEVKDKDAVNAKYIEAKERLEQRIANAPSGELKKKYEEDLVLLEQALDVVSNPGGDENNPSPNVDLPNSQGNKSSLSQTMLGDLPAMDPAYTVGVSSGQAPRIGIEPGQVLMDRYEIQEKIGSGGMGVVFKAFDRVKEQTIAIKFMLPQYVNNPEAKARFLKEAKASCNYSHPNIINVFDVQSVDNYLFITMELLEGQTLREALDIRKVARTDFTEEETRVILDQLTSALSYAHKTSVHRDIKPENIFLCEDGTLKLMDFGIVHLVNMSQFTKSSMAMGTAYYMAPEQLTGSGQIDARADQYSVGVVIYEMLSGQLPAGATAPLNTLRNDISKGFSHAVMKAISPKADERFESMEKFNKALDKKVFTSSSTRKSPSSVSFGMKALAAIAVVSLVSLGIYFFGSSLGGLFLSEEERAALQARAIQAQGKVQALTSRLERMDSEIDEQIETLESRAVKLKDQINKENDSTNRMRMQAELYLINSEVEMAKEKRVSANRWVYDSDQLIQAESALDVAESQIAEEKWKKSAQSFELALDEYEKVIRFVPDITAALEAKYEYKNAVNAWTAISSKLNLGNYQAPPELKSLDEQGQQHFNNGAFSKASSSWASAHTQLQQQSQTTRDKAIADLLGQAREAVEKSNLLTPYDNNAVAKYDMVLSLNSTNNQAINGLLNVANLYLRYADEATKQGQFDRSIEYLANARTVGLKPALAMHLEQIESRIATEEADIERERKASERRAEQRRLAQERAAEEQRRVEQQQREEKERARVEAANQKRIAQCISSCESSANRCKNNISYCRDSSDDCAASGLMSLLDKSASSSSRLNSYNSCISRAQSQQQQCESNRSRAISQCDSQGMQCERSCR
jgi:serine/threonine protein kinase